MLVYSKQRMTNIHFFSLSTNFRFTYFENLKIFIFMYCEEMTLKKYGIS